MTDYTPGINTKVFPMQTQIAIVDSLSAPRNGQGLAPTAMTKLPIGAVRPSGWLKRQLEIELNGIPGQLWKYSPFLAEGNGWLEPEKTWPDVWAPGRPWEEQAYWFRTFVKVAVLTGDSGSLAVAERYLNAMYASIEPDGWFGPRFLKRFPSNDPADKGTLVDLWPYMVMFEGVLTWYEYTGEKRWLDMLHGFLRFCSSLSDNELIPDPGSRKFHWMIIIQDARACDFIPSIARVIELTGDDSLLELAHRIYRKWLGPTSEFMDTHTVNFAQMFAYEALYSRFSHQRWHRNSADYWYGQHMSVWGTLPRGAFCADENARAGCTDPRYATESCTWAEFTRSFNLLGELNAEPVWADRTEDVLFNHYPAAYTADMKGLHYLTACNQVMLDDYLTHNVNNLAHQFAYSATANRCCLHNAGLGWPLLAEYQMTATCDGGACAWLHGAYSAKLEVGPGRTPIEWTSSGEYPFRNRITFTLRSDADAVFPFYLRIPRWCAAPEVRLNGETLSAGAAAGKLVKIEREWRNGDRIELTLPPEISLAENPRCGGVTVDRGPFSYSLRIPEIRNEVVSSGSGETYKKSMWDEAAPADGSRWTELLPGGPWNYGLVPERGFEAEEHPLPDDFVFSWDKAPVTISATAKKIPAWKLQDHMCAPLQKSPVRSAEPEEKVTLIPLGCARLRLSVFPVIGDSPAANEWREVPETTSVESRPRRR